MKKAAASAETANIMELPVNASATPTPRVGPPAVAFAMEPIVEDIALFTPLVLESLPDSTISGRIEFEDDLNSSMPMDQADAAAMSKYRLKP